MKGKTTLAAFVTQRLRRTPQEAPFQAVSIYVLSSVSTCDADFIEDFLVSTYNQLIRGTPVPNDDSVRLFADYIQAYNDGQASTYRIELLQSILQLELSSLAYAFLVLDGYDYLSKSLQIFLDQILHQFRSKLRVFFTRRCPQLIRALATGCDICQQPGVYLDLFWECQRCKDPYDSFALCYDCKNRKRTCTNCQDDLSFIEPYNYVNWRLNISDPVMSKFVQRSIEKARKRTNINLELVSRLVRQAKGNITVAKLRLVDALAKSESSTASRDRVSDRLPPYLVAFFDSGIKQVEKLPVEFRDVTLTAIIFVAEAVSAIDLEHLGQKLHAAAQSPSGLINHTFGCLEDLITAASGYLDVALDAPKSGVSCFHADFALYVRENYHAGIYDLKSRLQAPNLPYTLTGVMLSEQRSIVESPPPISHAADTTSDPLIAKSQIPSSTETGLFGLGLVQTSEWTNSTDRMKLSPPRMDSEQQLPLFSKAELLKAVPQTTRVCQFCLANVLIGKVSGPHHTSLKHATESEKTGCVFCSKLYEKMDGFIETHQPFYTWNVQSSGSKDIVIVFTHSSNPQGSSTFHMVQRSDRDDTPNPDSFGTSTDPYVSQGHQIKAWLKHCDEDHHGCRKASPTDFVPTRLLQLQSNNRDTVKLVITDEHSIREPYCTLSHSWGPPTPPFLTTTNENLQEFKRDGIDVSTLPKNFRHAIDVARFIGMKYIWIDSLCIIQKDNGEDFKREGDQMHRVYQNSYCNIVAADSKHSEGGLFRQREVSDVMPAEYHGKRIFGFQSWNIIPSDLWDAQLLGTSIYTRGWVFQERMLSPRLLHFAKKQIFWDCATLSACEGYPSGLPLAVDNTARTDRHWRGRLQQRSRDQKSLVVGENDDSIETFWRTAVLKYTSCDLTKQKDKTVAIWSIAKTVRDITGEEYACGLWGYRLEEQLVWTVHDGGKGSRKAELQWRFPSWSWVSVTGPISAAHRIVVERTYMVRDHTGHAITLPSPAPPEHDSKVSEKDREPLLHMPAAIPLRTVVHRGILTRSGTVSYRLLPQLSTETLPTQRSGTMNAFPDEQLDVGITENVRCTFVILAATQYQPETAVPYQQATLFSNSNQRYSGVGILLEEPASALPRYEQEIPRLQQEMQLITCPKDEWKKADMTEEIDYTKNLVARLTQQVNECVSGKQYYRRTGAVHFQDVDEEVWQDLMGGDGSCFWLI
jgi:hypothetical protein